MLRQGAVVAGLLLVLALPAASRAQGVMPGGWAPQFGYQVMVGPGAVGYGASGLFGVAQPGVASGFGYAGGYGFSPYGSGFGYPAYPSGIGFVPAPNTPTIAPPANTTVTAMDPLIHSIRHATRRRGGR